MITKRLIAMVAGTVSSALSVGFIMQHSASQQHPGMALSQPEQVHTADMAPLLPAVIELAADPKQDSVVTLQDVTLTSTLPEIKKPIVAIGNDNLPEIPVEPGSPQLGCAIVASATSADLASVALSVQAPCHRNEQVTVHHKGMMFTETTDAKGNLQVTVPALAKKAVFIIDFVAGGAKVVMAEVPNLAEHDRVAIQWSGAPGIEIHAREFGADYGDPGHAWSGSDSKSVGAVTRLGDAQGLAPRMVEIYTYPTGASARTGTVALSVEAEVSLANCGRDVTAQSLELHADGSLRTHEMVLAMPNCTAIGDFLVLNNLINDLKIAAK